MENRFSLKVILIAAIFIQAIGTDARAQRKTGRSKNIDIYMGSAIKKLEGTQVDQFVTANAKGFITHSYTTGEDRYTLYDTTLQPISTVKFDRLGSGESLVYKGFIVLKDKSVLLTGKTLFYDKANAVYLSWFDQEAMGLKDAVEITRTDAKGFYEDFANAHLNYSVSEDGSKFVIYFKLNGENDPVHRFRFVAFDSDLKKLWEQDAVFRSDDGNYRLGGSEWKSEPSGTSVCIANTGTVFCWGRTDKGDGYENEYRYHVKLSVISNAGHDMVELAGDQAKKYRDWVIHGTDAGMIMAANYMEWENKTKSSLEKSDGFAFVSWTGAVKQRPVFKTIEFDEDYLTLNQSKSVVKRVNRDQSNGAAGAFEDNFQINGFEKLDEDNYLVLGENRHDSTKFDLSLELNERLIKDATTYTRGDIHLFSINERDGKLNWSTRIPKDQQNKTGQGLGYTCKVVGNKLYVLFNDHIDNTEKEWDYRNGVGRFSKMDNPVVLQVIDIENPRTVERREKLWTTEKTEGYFEPNAFFSRPSSNEALLYIRGDGAKDRFVKMYFK